MKKFDLSSAVLSAAAASLMMASVTSCDGKIEQGGSSDLSFSESQTNTSSQINEPQGMVFPKATVNKNIIPTQLNFVQSINYANDSLYISGCISDPEINETTVLLDFDKMESVEINLEFPKRYISNLILDNENIYVCYTDDNYNTFLSITDRKTGKVKNKKNIDETYSMTRDIFLNGEKIFLFTAEQKIDADCSVKNTLEIFDKDLDLVEKLDLNDKLDLADNEQISMIIPDGKDSYYAISQTVASPYSSTLPETKTKLYRLSDKFETLYMTDKLGNTDTISSISEGITAGNGNLYVTMRSDELSYEINEIDSDNGDIVNTYKLNDAVALYRGTDKYDIVYQNFSGDGLYGYDIETDESTLLFTYGDELNPKLAEVNCYSVYGNQMLINSQDMNDNSIQTLIMDPDGKIKDELRLDSYLENGYIERIYVTEEGNIYCLESAERLTWTEDSEDSETTYIESHLINKLDSDGRQLESIDLAEIIGNETDVYIEDFMIDNDGKIYVVFNKETGFSINKYIIVTDKNGNLIISEELPEEISEANLVLLSDNSPAISAVNGNQLVIQKIGNDGLLTDERFYHEINNDSDEELFIYQGSDEYDLFFTLGDILYGYSLKNDKEKPLFDLSNYGLDIEQLYPVNDKKLFFTAYEEIDHDTELICHIEVTE